MAKAKPVQIEAVERLLLTSIRLIRRARREVVVVRGRAGRMSQLQSDAVVEADALAQP